MATKKQEPGCEECKGALVVTIKGKEQPCRCTPEGKAQAEAQAEVQRQLDYKREEAAAKADADAAREAASQVEEAEMAALAEGYALFSALDEDEGLVRTGPASLGFSAAPTAPTAGVTGAQAMAQAMSGAAAEVFARIMAAQANPRNEREAVDRLMASLKRPSLADKAEYNYSRGGKPVAGPSVYLTRAAVQAWGNSFSGYDVQEETAEAVLVRGVFVDLERNVTKTVSHRQPKLIQRKQPDGSTRWVVPDPRDLREMIAKIGAILERNAAVHGLPPDLVAMARERAKRTLHGIAKAALKDREKAVDGLLVSFADFKVSRAMIEERLGHDLMEITAKELADLRGLWVALRDGATHVHTEWPDAAAMPAAGGGQAQPKTGADLADRLKQEAAKAAQGAPKGE